jgi:FixJ family two-component response regulator
MVPRARAGSATVRAEDARKIRVFIVDDEQSVRRGLGRLLKSAGFRVEAFESGEAFLERPPPRGDHCLVLDVRMAGMSGPELFETLRAQGRDSPMIFVTAHGTDELKAEMSTETVLAKPIDAEILIGAIEAAVARIRISRAQRSARPAAGRR